MTLPALPPAFRWSVESWGYGLRCQPLEAIAQHVFTTRQLPLRSLTSSDGEISRRAWREAAASLASECAQVRQIRQVHGAAVRVVRQDDDDPQVRPVADAQATSVPGLVLAVQVADCAPILMADRTTGAVAAVHAGWRGTAARVSQHAVRAMSTAFGSAPADLVVALGPSIGPCCYEVGPELILAYRAAGFAADQLERWFLTSGASLRLDVTRANVDQIAASGVPAHQIFAAGLCTQTHRDLFASFRAEGARAGRIAGLIRCGPPRSGLAISPA